MGLRGVFLDRDGVINIDHGYVYRIEDFTLIDGVLQACRAWKEHGFALVIVSNQSGIARGFFAPADLARLNEHIKTLFDKAGAPLSGIYCCPHLKDAPVAAYNVVCHCRKPEPGLFLQAAQELAIDLTTSIAFGDKNRDLEAAHRAGVPTRILLGKDGLVEPTITPDATGTARNLLLATERLLAGTL